MIYYVEDDDNIRELVVYTLTQMSLPCRGFADGAAFRAAVAEATPDLVLLDIMLPGEDGLSLLRFLRENHRTAKRRSSCSPPRVPKWTRYRALTTARMTTW